MNSTLFTWVGLLVLFLVAMMLLSRRIKEVIDLRKENKRLREIIRLRKI